MWIKTQYGGLVNLRDIHMIYIHDDCVILAVGERTFSLGDYATLERAKAVLESILVAMHMGNKIYRMPEE